MVIISPHLHVDYNDPFEHVKNLFELRAVFVSSTQFNIQ